MDKTTATDALKANHETNPHALLAGDRVMLTKDLQTRDGVKWPARLVVTVAGTRLVALSAPMRGQAAGSNLAIRVTLADTRGNEMHLWADDDSIQPYRAR